MRPSPKKNVGLIGVLIFCSMMTTCSMFLVPEVPPPFLPACRAKRLPLEGISIFCDLQQTNIPLYCKFCLKGEFANKSLGRPTYHRPYNISGVITGESCELTYFPKRIGTYTFSVTITNIRHPLVTNDVIISELPELKLQRTCQDRRLRVTCTGIWHLATPFMRMSRDGLDSGEIAIRSELVVGRNDTYFTEAVMSFGDDKQAGLVNVTCEAVYKVQSHFRHVDNSVMVDFNASRRRVKVTLVKLSDSVVQCTAEVPYLKLSLYCTIYSNTNERRRYGESPLSFNISGIGNFRSARCVCAEHNSEACHDDAEASVDFEQTSADNSLMAGGATAITPIFRDGYGLPVNRTYVVTAGTTFFIFSLKGHQPTLTPTAVNDSPLSDSSSEKDSVPYGHYAFAGIVLLAFIALATSAIIYVYLYWKDLRRSNSNRSSPSPTQSNDYACIEHSPKSSKSSSAPGETCALLEIEISSPPTSSDDSGSGGSSSPSNQYFNDSPDDNQSSAYDQIDNSHSAHIDIQACLPFRI